MDGRFFWMEMRWGGWVGGFFFGLVDTLGSFQIPLYLRISVYSLLVVHVVFDSADTLLVNLSLSNSTFILLIGNGGFSLSFVRFLVIT